jgi:hypothetical protein
VRFSLAGEKSALPKHRRSGSNMAVMRTVLVLTLFGFVLKSVAADDKVDFKKDIRPILDQNCLKCHGEEKQKGKLRLDSREAALKGGKAGPALAAGDAAKSELYRRITLPKDDDDFMPSEGEPLSKAQLDLIRDWIAQGAVWPDDPKVAEKKSSANEPVLPADFKPGPNEAKAIAKLAETGVEARPIAVNVPWREANFRLQGTNITDGTLVPLKDMASLVEVNLATTRVTDAGLANLKGLTNLMRLHLELTDITDAGLAHIKDLKNLTYLNLYATKVTDAGLEHVKELPRLKNLYLWQTKTTEAGVAKLKEKLPDVQVSTGAELAQLAKKIEEQKEKAKKEETEKKEKEAAAKAKKDEGKKEEAKKEEAKKEEKKEPAKEEKKDEKKEEPKKDEKKAEPKEPAKEPKPEEKK